MDALTKRLIERIGELERRLAIVEGAESNITPTIRAATSIGVQIQDDAGNLGVSVADGGQVGIGRISTTYNLEVLTGAGIYRTGNNPYIVFNYSDENVAQIRGQSGDGLSITGGAGASTTYALFNATGVGIGTAVPGYPLHVVGNAYFTADVSALTFTDRTKGYAGDALAELRAVGTKGGELDHDTLPSFARHENGGRDLGAMISMLTVAVQQLSARVDELENA